MPKSWVLEAAEAEWVAPERFGRRLTRGEARKLFTDAKLDAQKKAFAQWEDFQAGAA